MHFLRAAPAVMRNLSGVDRPLQRVNRFTPIEHSMNFATEYRLSKVVAQVDRPQQASQHLCRPVDRVALRRGTKSLEDVYCAHRAVERIQSGASQPHKAKMKGNR